MGESGDNNSSVEDNHQVSRSLSLGDLAAKSDQGDYLDFEMEIDPGTGREYPTLVKSPAGEARGLLRFPFDELALENSLKSLQIALLRSGGEHRLILSSDDKAVQDLGRQLFDSLFMGEVRSRFDTSVASARFDRRGLRIKLRINAPELAYLPWEFLYDSRTGQYICLSRDTPIVRYLELPYPIEPLTIEPPLQILGMICSPSDLPPLRVDIEKQRLEKALDVLQRNGLVKLNWLVGQSWRDLHRAMRGGPFHIFHFLGHGGFNNAIDQGMLALAGEQGEGEMISATDLGILLSDHRSLRLVFLNSCEGALGSVEDVFSSTSSILVRQGIPAVLAMQYAITDRAAIEFSRSFYEALADGLPVDAAVSEARKAIRLAVRNSYEWGTPVLYMRAPQGVLFKTPDEEREKRTITGEMPSVVLEKQIPRNAEELFREGMNAFAEEDWEKAIQLFSEVALLQPSHIESARQLDEAQRQRNFTKSYTAAKAAMERYDWETALKLLTELTQETPDYKDVSVLLQRARQNACLWKYEEARNKYRDGLWQEVIDIFEKINAIDPSFVDENDLKISAQNEIHKQLRKRDEEKFYQYAQAMMEIQDWKEAITALEKMIELNSSNKDLPKLLEECRTKLRISNLYGQAYQYNQERRWQDVLDVFAEIKSLQPDFRDPQEVQSTAEKALLKEKQQKNIDNYYQQALYATKVGDWDNAINLLESLRKIGPDNLPEVNKMLDRAKSEKLASQKKAQEQQERIDRERKDEAERLKMQQAEQYLTTGRLKIDKNDYEGAIADFNKTLRLNPQCAEAYAFRGLTYSMSGRSNEALVDINQALHLNSQIDWFYSYRGIIYMAVGKNKEAIADFDRSLKLDPRDENTYYCRGHAYYNIDQHEKALVDLDQAIHLNPNFQKAYEARGMAYGMSGKFREAIADFDKAIELNPQSAECYYSRGLLHEKLWHFRQSRADIKKARELGLEVE